MRRRWTCLWLEDEGRAMAGGWGGGEDEGERERLVGSSRKGRKERGLARALEKEEKAVLVKEERGRARFARKDGGRELEGREGRRARAGGKREGIERGVRGQEGRG